MKRAKKLYSHFGKAIKRPEISILPGQLSFYFLMSLVPIIALTSLIAAKIVTGLNLTNVFASFLPASLSNIFISTVRSASSYNNLFLLLFLYIFLGSNGPMAIITASNTLYGLKRKGWVETKLKAMFMTIVMIILLLFLCLIPVGGNFLLTFLAQHYTFFKKVYEFGPLYYSIKYVLSFFVIYISCKLLYTMAPNKKVKSRDTTIGAVFTSVTWIISSELLLFYFSKVATYSALYGNFANILILLLWVYLLAYLFVIGMALNIDWYKREDEEGEIDESMDIKKDQDNKK